MDDGDTTPEEDRSELVNRVVGSQLRKRRIMLGMSEQVLAEKLYLTRSNIQEYERGEKRLDVTLMTEICKILDVSPAFMYGASGDSGSGRA
jgi:transcriptional regulator with XRE-family HTH domain